MKLDCVCKSGLQQRSACQQAAVRGLSFNIGRGHRVGHRQENIFSCTRAVCRDSQNATALSIVYAHTSGPAEKVHAVFCTDASSVGATCRKGFSALHALFYITSEVMKA